MNGNFNKLMEPIRIGSVEIKNRIAMAPMGIVGLLNPDGSPGQRALDYYIERARGGVGLIITSLFKVEIEIEQWRLSPPLITPKVIAPFSELAESVHALGGRIFVQLSAGFGRVLAPQNLVAKPISASAVPYFWNPGITCRALETGEVEKLVEGFGIAAEILAAAGIDGVEFHAHEGYLFDQFATPIWNKRKDKYGGDLESRLRFAIEALGEIRKKAGRDFPVQYRFGLKHYMKALNEGALPGERFVEAGRDVEEGIEMAKILEHAGFDSFHVDAGCYDSHYWAHPPVYQEKGCMTDMAKRVKEVVKVPVVAVGKLGNPDIAQKVLEEGKADIIALGRNLLSDPYWMRKVEQARPERIRPCIGCFDGCLGRILYGKPLSCAVNPTVGRETAYSIRKTQESKRVMIVGSGVAGMEAARILAIRGHDVVLYEKTDLPGGCLIPAGTPSFKKELRDLLDWYNLEIARMGLEVKTGHEVTGEFVEENRPEVVILANGARPIVPNSQRTDEGSTATASDVLLGTKQTGGRVAVIGGGLVGCETALWLAQQGKEVTVVDMLEELMSGRVRVPKVTKEMLLDMLKFNRVKVMTGMELSEFGNGKALLTTPSGGEETLEYDSVVFALGFEPDRKLYESLMGNVPELYLIGDAREARNIMGAVWDAYEVARTI